MPRPWSAVAAPGFPPITALRWSNWKPDAQEHGGWQRHLHPVDWVVRDMKTVTVGPAAEKFLRNGQSVRPGPA